jgi:HlyD family secretion protein
MKARVVVLVLIVVALVAGGAWWLRQRAAPASNELTLHGNVDIRQVELAFNASGRIASMLVQEGEQVKAEQSLALLDTERLSLSLAQAEAQANAQRQVLARLLAGSRPEEIAQARAARDAAKVAAAEAEAFHQRQVDLVARHFVSQQQADTARFALDKTREQLKAAEQTLHLAELGPRQEDIAGARATLAALEAAVAGLRRDLREGNLVAPAAGVIEKRILQPGDMASPAKPVFTLALTDPLWVRVWLPETHLGRIPVGARASIGTDSHPERRYPAWIGYVSPSAEFTPKTVETVEVRSSLVYQARVFVCAGGGELRLGMPANVTIALDQPVPAAGDDPCAK